MDSDNDDFGLDFDPSIVQRLPWLETPLAADKNCIRLLKLEAGSGDNPLVCKLQIVSLDDDPYYEALSYVWGDPGKTRRIFVGGENFDVTQNLSDFLHCLRSPRASRLLWADAICIDQTTIVEKNHQLRLMGRIYRQAKEVVVWFGHFTERWEDELVENCEAFTTIYREDSDSGEASIPTSQMNNDAWNYAEDFCRIYLPGYLQAGGQCPNFKELCNPKRLSRDELLSEALRVLDKVAGGSCLHNFPLFCSRDDPKNNREVIMVNRYWPVLLDCLRWFALRPWWTRVWTVQEAVLPRADPFVYVGSYTLRLSRLIDGMKSLTLHSVERCCQNIQNMFLANYQNFSWGPFAAIMNISEHREKFVKGSGQHALHTSDIIHLSQRRRATDPRDHFLGMLGLMPAGTAEHFQNLGYSLSSAELFSQCTKLLYGYPDNLDDLEDAVGVRYCTIPNLPTWAMDLTQRPGQYEVDTHRWQLYSASPGTRYEGATKDEDLPGFTLTFEAIPLGTIAACASRVPSSDVTAAMVLSHVSEWQQLYLGSTASPDRDSFWRTVLMDRYIRQYWLHKRKPLHHRGLADVQAWFEHYSRTGDERDLKEDTHHFRPTDDGSKWGTYHYRAVKLNVQTCRFFTTTTGVPGMGPHEVQAADELFVLAGSKAPAVLRPARRGGTEMYLFVGLCFVDGIMYGEALRRGVKWRNITVI
ncbi:hypothetical protein MMC13_006841 [Lambiella insularis]|nr:hypothetical protein [Lambiella insularis]